MLFNYGWNDNKRKNCICCGQIYYGFVNFGVENYSIDEAATETLWLVLLMNAGKYQ